MKATDLMIGDWVGRVFDDKRIIEDYRQVDWIRTGEIGMRYRKVWSIGCIEPIPLTPYILEKNGWKRDCRGFMEKEVNRNAYLSWDGYRATLYQDNHYMCDCKYVHTIQHALRLFGLDELADNFKV